MREWYDWRHLIHLLLFFSVQSNNAIFFSLCVTGGLDRRHHNRLSAQPETTKSKWLRGRLAAVVDVVLFLPFFSKDITMAGIALGVTICCF